MSFHKLFFLIPVTFLSLFLAIFVLFRQCIIPTQASNSIVILQPTLIQQSMLQYFIQQCNSNLTYTQIRLINSEIQKQSKIHGFDPFFLASLIAAESSFNPYAVSSRRAQGLMQLTASVLSMMKVSNPFNIQQNIRAGTQYLSFLAHRFNHSELVLAAYNAGPTRVARLKRIPNIAETLFYIQKIKRYHTYLKSYFQQTIQSFWVKPRLFASLESFPEFLVVQQKSISTFNYFTNLEVLDICEQRRPKFFV
ncbi:transglycosylase-like protein with SLT domain [Hydrogenispora ethanolica]|uniref:Transglycosylase-like protein with SLT domain n=1 Tax=Hydrogenispora ethanolica TaxID=1082276 RepID=A0A4R1S9Z2_HYDET|nr:lytic transglycosylase domain-containing protein [Hydrogenispora ethanolica]TCL76315.1 transglycosylase-like protein with SLT domain [Hydrogenispora ethanolica]